MSIHVRTATGEKLVGRHRIGSIHSEDGAVDPVVAQLETFRLMRQIRLVLIVGLHIAYVGRFDDENVALRFSDDYVQRHTVTAIHQQSMFDTALEPGLQRI